MREIKFRVWDKTRNEMFCYKNQSGIKQLNFTQDMSIESVELFEYIPDGSFVFKTLTINDIELMQYTGLKDKNGVEIYDGDIVTFFTRSGKQKRLVQWQNDGRWLPFCDDEFIQDELGDWFLFESEGGPQFEVIGNIYENPELLRDTHE